MGSLSLESLPSIEVTVFRRLGVSLPAETSMEDSGRKLIKSILMAAPVFWLTTEMQRRFQAESIFNVLASCFLALAALAFWGFAYKTSK